MTKWHTLMGIFGSLFAAIGHAQGQFPNSGAPTSQIQVIGVIASSRVANGIALVKSGETTKALRTGEEIQGNQLVEVRNKYVIFQSSQGTIRVKVGSDIPDNSSGYSAPLPPESFQHPTMAGLERKGNTITATSSLRDKIVNEDLSKVLMQAAAVPNYRDGVLHGFRFAEIDPGSIYEQIGFRNGDIITEINGIRLTNVASTIKLLQNLKGSSGAEVTFLRNGAQENLNVQIQ